MKENNSIIHIITGDGKGKTTSALGLVLRAIGAGKKVKIIQFMKKPETSEYKAIKKYKLPIDIQTFGIGYYKILDDTKPQEEHKKACERGLATAQKAIESGKYDLIILDEINVAVGLGLLNIDDVISILNPHRHIGSGGSRLDIVLTGRRAHPKLKKIAHLISDIRKIKHYFDDGIQARKGIEF